MKKKLLTPVLCLLMSIIVASTARANIFNYHTYTTNSFLFSENLVGTSINSDAVYQTMNLDSYGLEKSALDYAVEGYDKLLQEGLVENTQYLTIVDFSQPSINKRLYVIDLNTYQLLYNTYVAHGMKTGKVTATSFSNKPSSNKSSLGFYVTGNAYQGCNGYSLKLQGMEKGINDYAMRRGIVLHGADYVNEEYISSQGYIGRSYGCPAVAPEISVELIDMVKDGTCLFIYHPSATYRAKSKLVK